MSHETPQTPERSDEAPQTRKRRVVVQLTARENDDPRAILAAVRNALSGHGVKLVTRTVKDEGQAPADSTSSITIFTSGGSSVIAGERSQAVLDEATNPAEEKPRSRYGEVTTCCAVVALMGALGWYCTTDPLAGLFLVVCLTATAAMVATLSSWIATAAQNNHSIVLRFLETLRAYLADDRRSFETNGRL
jgi:hypothetical protein